MEGSGYNWRQRARGVIAQTIVDEEGRIISTTGIGDLENMLDLYNRSSQRFTETNITPQQMEQQLAQGNALIAGVSINNNDGSLGGIVNHWIVVEAIYPNGTGGTVVYYNPFTNQQEVCTFDELITAMGEFGDGQGYSGLWAQTDTQP